MILCVNLNAAVDRTLVVDQLSTGGIHRPASVLALPGGKGANAARSLHRLGRAATVMGLVGGTSGKFIERGLAAEGIPTSLVEVDHESRLCTSVIDDSTGAVTEFYEPGAPVAKRELDAFCDRYERSVALHAAVLLCGSLPPGAPDHFYADLIELADANGVPVLLDTSGAALRAGVAAGPTVIKPNRAELQAVANFSILTIGDCATVARDLARTHGTVVIVSLGADGALVADREQVTHVCPQPITARCAVGSGDALLAGFALGLLDGCGIVEAAKRGVAAGTANALTIGGGIFSLERYEEIYEGLEVRELGLHPSG